MFLLICYKRNCLETPELTSIDKKGEFSWYAVCGLVETESFAVTHLPEAHSTSVLQLQEQIRGQICLSHLKRGNTCICGPRER